jgi:hypothetical protein
MDRNTRFLRQYTFRYPGDFDHNLHIDTSFRENDLFQPSGPKMLHDLLYIPFSITSLHIPKVIESDSWINVSDSSQYLFFTGGLGMYSGSQHALLIVFLPTFDASRISS